MAGGAQYRATRHLRDHLGGGRMPGSTVESIPATERIATLDILRGFALLGILIMNMPGFGQSFFAEADGSHLWPGAVDQWAESVRYKLLRWASESDARL
jgi:hypothetical protein